MPTPKTFRTSLILATLTTIYLCLPQVTRAEEQLRPEFQQVEEDPNLPRVLLIGDSISIGYTLPVREYLKGIANVQRPSTNCTHTANGVAQLDKWLGEKPWDVIHFNFGLHDLKCVDENGNRVDGPTDGVRQIPIDQYKKNLEKMIQRMKKTGAVLIWCTTTPVPKGVKGGVPGDAVTYNEAALQVMKKHNVAINDLHTFSFPRLKELQPPANVHFTEHGCKVLGKEVAEKIKEELGKMK